MMSSEDENYVTVTVKARGREVSVPYREAVVVTKRAGGALGPALHVGDIGPGSFTVLAEAAVSELVSLGVRAGIPEDRARIELVYAATRCGYSEEEERDALYCSLDNDVDEEPGKEGEDE